MTPTRWLPGYTARELAQAKDRYGLRFPPDLVQLLLERRPAGSIDWVNDDAGVRKMLDWPFDLLKFDVEHGAWWPDWGARPASPNEQIDALRQALAKAPNLIPVLGHRFLPEQPHEAGNPVFSMHGFDTIYYGANLDEYFANEFDYSRGTGTPKHIPFWSDLAEEKFNPYPPVDVARLQFALLRGAGLSTHDEQS